MTIEAATPAAAFVAGLATSLHCAGMCGPLACAVRVRPLEYHVSRLVSYSLVGAGCGAAGAGLVTLVKSDAARALPWALAAVLLVMGLGLEKRIPQPRFVAQFLARLRLSRSLGWLTPLLPCGPLWLMFGVAVVAGSAPRGALLLACFAAGTAPLYWLLQSQLLRAEHRLNPKHLRWAQQGLALTAAALMAWRAMIPSHGSCCH
jgi:hypothetical protein